MVGEHRGLVGEHRILAGVDKRLAGVDMGLVVIDFKNIEVDKLEGVDRELLKWIGVSRPRMKCKIQQLKTYYQPNI